MHFQKVFNPYLLPKEDFNKPRTQSAHEERRSAKFLLMVAIVEKKIFASLWLIDFWRSKANFLHSLSIDIPTYYTKLALLCIRNMYKWVKQIMFNPSVFSSEFYVCSGNDVIFTL